MSQAQETEGYAALVAARAPALLRLAGAVLVEQHEEWDVSERRYLAETTMKLLDHQPQEVATAALEAA